MRLPMLPILHRYFNTLDDSAEIIISVPPSKPILYPSTAPSEEVSAVMSNLLCDIPSSHNNFFTTTKPANFRPYIKVTIKEN